MNLKTIGCLALSCILVAPWAAAAETIEIVVWAPADRNERYRYEGVALAAKILNEELKIEGRSARVTVRAQAFSGAQTWQKLKQGSPSRSKPAGDRISSSAATRTLRFGDAPALSNPSKTSSISSNGP